MLGASRERRKTMMNAVATTGLLVAAMRAEESIRPDRLFDDPFATLLAGERGKSALATYRTAAGVSVPIIEVRTRFFDEGLGRATHDDIRQFAIVAAGMDARAHRLPWPPGTRVFELDQPEVLAHKATVLADAKPACERIAVPVDLTRDWTDAIQTRGFDPALPTAWLVEGLLQYLDEPSVRTLFERIDRLSGPHSVILYDVVGQSLLRAPQFANALAMMKELGAPWLFATDDPASLVSNAWSVTAFDPGEIGRRWGRWPFPPAPPNTPAPSLGYLLEARKA